MVEGGATATPGLMQPVRILSIVHLQKLMSILESVLSLHSLQRKRRQCLGVFCDVVW